jgi:hypothetical protein
MMVVIIINDADDDCVGGRSEVCDAALEATDVTCT